MCTGQEKSRSRNGKDREVEGQAATEVPGKRVKKADHQLSATLGPSRERDDSTRVSLGKPLPKH